MFPVDANDTYRDNDGSLKKMGDVVGGADLPEHTSSDAGKVLTIGEDGSLEWDTKGAGGGFYDDYIRPIWTLNLSDDTRLRFTVTRLPIDVSVPSGVTSIDASSYLQYPLSDLLNFGFVKCAELYKFLTDPIINALNAVPLYTGTDSVSSIELSSGIDNFEFLAFQGMYNTEYNNQYNTTIIYKDPAINTPYWFGVKDRNSSYCGTITFTDNTHATLSASRRIRIYGFNR